MNKTAPDITFGEAAIGTIEAGPNQQERLDEFTTRVGSGEFHHDINWQEAFKKMILLRCVDGRLPENGSATPAPNSAGGSESLFVADDLTEKRFALDGSVTSGYENILNFLHDNGYEIGGHTGTHAAGSASGCGANDKLDMIYAYMAQCGDTLRTLAAGLGVQIADEMHELLTANAAARTEFSTGRSLLDILQAKANPLFVDTLAGEHREVATVVNTRRGTTLDRDTLAYEFGPNYQAFNVDVWAFEAAARAISKPDASDDMIASKVAALVYYNLATALVLSGPAMRLVTVSE